MAKSNTYYDPNAEQKVDWLNLSDDEWATINETARADAKQLPSPLCEETLGSRPLFPEDEGKAA